MASSSALVGLGVPPQLADVLGFEPSTVTGTGTTQGGAALIKSQNAEMVTAAGQTAAILPADRPVGVPFIVNCPTATSGVVFVPVGAYLNGTQNGSLTIAQNKAAMFFQYKQGYWVSILTA